MVRLLRGKLSSDFTSMNFVGRSADLEKAYKQLAGLPAHARLAVVGVWDPIEKKVRLFLHKSTPFGVALAVLGFNVVARALEWLAVRLLDIPAVHYFDDFPLVTLVEDASSTISSFESLLSLLGWDLKGGDKDPPWSPIFDSLGARFDLSGVGASSILTVHNKPGRAEGILEHINDCKLEGAVKPHFKASLSGRVHFSVGQTFGRLGGVLLQEIRACGTLNAT